MQALHAIVLFYEKLMLNNNAVFKNINSLSEKFPKKLKSHQIMQPNTLIRREYKVKIYNKKEKIHVGSETGSGSETK